MGPAQADRNDVINHLGLLSASPAVRFALEHLDPYLVPFVVVPASRGRWRGDAQGSVTGPIRSGSRLDVCMGGVDGRASDYEGPCWPGVLKSLSPGVTSPVFLHSCGQVKPRTPGALTPIICQCSDGLLWCSLWWNW